VKDDINTDASIFERIDERRCNCAVTVIAIGEDQIY
jgi:hypothetical protein